MMHDPVEISQCRHSHTYVFNQSTCSVKTNYVSDAISIFQYNKKSRNNISDEILSAKAKGETCNSGRSQKWTYGDTNFLKDDQKSEEPNKYSGRKSKNANESIRSLSLLFFEQRTIRNDDLFYDFFNKNAHKFADQQSQNDDRNNLYTVIIKLRSEVANNAYKRIKND